MKVFLLVLILLFIGNFPALLSGSNKERLLKEVTLMLSFDHPNVMSLIGICFDGEVPLLIMPFMSGGSVLNYVTQNRENLHFTDDSLENEKHYIANPRRTTYACAVPLMD